MIDDLRDQADSPFADDEPYYEFEEEEKPPAPRQPEERVLGMTAAQRLVIAAMVLMMTCLLSVFCLMITGRIALPLP